MQDRESRYRAYLAGREEAGLARRLMPLTRDRGWVTIADRCYLDVSSNDYLGLSAHPALIERARAWAERFGTGAAASRLVTGNLDLFEAVETKVAALKGKEAALILASGFQANSAVLEALLDRTVLGAEPLVFADRLNHASLHFGCRAAGVRQIRYRSCDADHLETLLDRYADDPRPKFIVTDSVFSMDGTVAPLDRIADLARAHGAFLYVDDAHATCVLGEGGRGLGGRADLVMGTFSKGLGSFGAYVACSTVLRHYLVNRCAGLIYSTALPPPVLGAIDAALDLLPGLEADRAHLQALSARLRDGAAALGWDTGGSTTHIVPIIAGEADAALALMGRFQEAGIWAVAIRPPTVPRGTARLRLALSAAHRAEDVERLLAVLDPGRSGLRRVG